MTGPGSQCLQDLPQLQRENCPRAHASQAVHTQCQWRVGHKGLDSFGPTRDTLMVEQSFRFPASWPRLCRSYIDSNWTPCSNPRFLPPFFQLVQFSSVAQLCLTLCDPMNCSMPSLPVHHQLFQLLIPNKHLVPQTTSQGFLLESPPHDNYFSSSCFYWRCFSYDPQIVDW